MKVIFIVGPTASGKSEFALNLAIQNKGVIVNCDSVQAYAKVSIGAAKPTQEEMKLVPHYLYGHIAPLNKYTAGQYRRDFFELMEVLNQKSIENVYVVGGTGFYFQAIEKGMFEVHESTPQIKLQLQEEARAQNGLQNLYSELLKFDPESAHKIHPNDEYRLIRAIEIIRTSGRKPSELKKEIKDAAMPFPYPLEKIGVNRAREDLHRRIQLRVKKMLSLGFIAEVQELRSEGLKDWEPMKSVGYKEVQSYLDGEIKTISELEDKIVISTRQLAKRQLTWFKRDQAIHWR